MKRRSTALLEEPEEEEPLVAELDSTGTAAGTADSLFAKALTNLSFNDRTAIEDEIHGVSCIAIKETPDLLEQSLIDFELELHKINHKPAYDKAQELSFNNPSSSSSTVPSSSMSISISSHNSSKSYSSGGGCTSSYINEKKFRLRFLRCELFHVRKAAERYIKYLDFLVEVYGEYALRRPIRMSDLTNEEMQFLREGQHQILPYVDRSGRRIIGIIPKKVKNVSKQVLLKVHFYLFNACVGGYDTTDNDFNNIECHQKGVVIVYFPSWHHGIETAKSKLQKTKNQVQRMVVQIVPIRVVCVHLCFPNTQVYRVYGKVAAMTLPAWKLPRIKIHLGTPVEWRYALQAYGIPTEIIPSTHTGNVKLDKWKQWIKLKAYTEQLTQEQMMMSEERTTTALVSSGLDISGNSSHCHSNASSCESTASASTSASISESALALTLMNNIVECPGSNDVLFRRGRSIDFHPGNAMFQNIIESRILRHSDPNTTQAQKEAIEMEVIQQVQQKGHGGRFLKWEVDKGWWSNMSVVDMRVDMDIDMGMNVNMNIDNNMTTSVDTCSTNGDSSSSINSVPTNANVNSNVNANMNAKYFEANKEIQSKVHYAFRDFKKKIMRAQQKQQRIQVNTSSTYAFERQDGQKRNRSNNNNNNDTTTVAKENSADDSSGSSDSDRICMPFLPDNTNGDTCGYFYSDANNSFYNNNFTD